MPDQLDVDFQRARTKAFWRDLASHMSRRKTKLLPFDEVERRLKIYNQRYLGLRRVEIAQIVGTVGRYNDFDRAFLPTHSRDKERWKSIAEAHDLRAPLPPVKLYKVGEIYFVIDGHHRVSVARERGEKSIEAEVTDCMSKVHLRKDTDFGEVLLKGEYIDFHERTGLDRLRPEQNVELTVLGRYWQLDERIAIQMYHLAQEREVPVSLEEAVSSWYDDVYTPIVKIIRERGVMARFPGRTEADLYLWIIENWRELKLKYGIAREPSDVALKLTKGRGKKTD